MIPLFIEHMMIGTVVWATAWNAAMLATLMTFALAIGMHMWNQAAP